MRNSIELEASERTWRLLKQYAFIVCCSLVTSACLVACSGETVFHGKYAWHSKSPFSVRSPQVVSNTGTPVWPNNMNVSRTKGIAAQHAESKAAGTRCRRTVSPHCQQSVAPSAAVLEAPSQSRLSRRLQQRYNPHQWSRDAHETPTTARVITPPAPDTRNIVHAFTPEAAEAVAYSEPSGIHRITTPQARQTYATVELDPHDDNRGAGRGSTVKPYARSAQDLAGARFQRRRYNGDDGSSYSPSRGIKRNKGSTSGGDPKYISSGTVMQPILVMGEMAYAQTYSGATAVAASDSLALNKGGKAGTPAGTTTAANNAVTWVPGLVAANPAQRSSVGVSNSERVGSFAASGAADGKIALAQAESAVALAQAEGIEWHENDREDWHDRKYLSKDWSEPDHDVWDWFGAAVAGQHDDNAPGVSG